VRNFQPLSYFQRSTAKDRPPRGSLQVRGQYSFAVKRRLFSTPEELESPPAKPVDAFEESAARTSRFLLAADAFMTLSNSPTMPMIVSVNRLMAEAGVLWGPFQAFHEPLGTGFNHPLQETRASLNRSELAWCDRKAGRLTGDRDDATLTQITGNSGKGTGLTWHSPASLTGTTLVGWILLVNSASLGSHRIKIPMRCSDQGTECAMNQSGPI
jgi:hypothetical protein